MRILITGGPGSGCSSTALLVAEMLGLPVYDSDEFFHKPTNPPFQEQYSKEERWQLATEHLCGDSGWVLAGSVSTWELPHLSLTHAILLDMGKEVRMQRLLEREQSRFGTRILPGGDMHEEHELFMPWAAGYEERKNHGRNLTTDTAFAQVSSPRLLTLTQPSTIEDIAAQIIGYISMP